MRNLVIVVLLTLALNGYSQDSPALQKFKISDAFIQFGGFNEKGNHITINEFKKLAPGSQLLKMDLSQFDEYIYDYNSPGYTVGAAVGLRLRNSEGTAYKRSPMLRLGLTYRNHEPYSIDYADGIVTRYDTLKGNHGEVFYMDSVVSKLLGMEYRTNELRMDISMTFCTNPDARWSLYGGGGISFGWLFNNYTKLHYSETDAIQMTRSEGGEFLYHDYDSDYYHSRTESFNNKNGFSASVFVPVGVDFRIARRGEFFKRLHLFVEFRPGINFTSIPELESSTRFFMNTNFGLRVNW